MNDELWDRRRIQLEQEVRKAALNLLGHTGSHRFELLLDPPNTALRVFTGASLTTTETNSAAPRNKPCTRDNCLGSSTSCRVEADERLGELWHRRKRTHSGAQPELSADFHEALKRVWKGHAPAVDMGQLLVLSQLKLVVATGDERQYVVTDAGRALVGSVPA